MPKIFEYNGYSFYFWSNEFSNGKLGPIHVHVSKTLEHNAPKFWLMKDGSTKIDPMFDNKLSKRLISLFEEIITANREEIFEKWFDHFGSAEYKETL